MAEPVKHPVGWQAPGQWLLVLTVVISSMLWLLAQPGLDAVTADPLFSLGKLCGVIGLTLYVNNIVLASRLKVFEFLFGGLNKVYRVHHTQGGLAFIAMLLHPTLLLLGRWDNPELARSYLVPSEEAVRSGYTAGVFALLILIVLLSITYWAKIPYQWWKRTHYLIGIPAFFLLIHVLLVQSDVSTNFPLKVWLVGLLVVGIFARAYKFVWLRYVQRGYAYDITNLRMLNDVTEVSAEPARATMSYLPGQFGYVTFTGSNLPKEEHPFSISTYDTTGKIRFSIKNSGDFTAMLAGIKQGQRLHVQGPFGIFGHSVYESKHPIVMVAGGIGITPFMSLLTWLAQHDTDRQVRLFYSVKDASELIYEPELNNLKKQLPNLEVSTVISNTTGLLTADKIIADALPKSRYLICGPPGMQNAIIGQLKDKGVSNLHIESELFSL